jgi:hypothetical protein
MNQRRLVVLALIVAAACQGTAARAVTIFNDTFATSTFNAATPAAPTPTSTDYAFVSSKNATGSMTAGSFITKIPTTSSGLNEIQARFRSTPVALTAEGDFIELSVTFKPTGILYTVNNTAATLGVGLYNSHGTSPVPGGQMASSLLGTADSTFADGYVAGWEGFATKLRLANAELYTRPAQNATNNQNQDLIFRSGVTGGFNSPAASIITPNATQGLQLTDGSTYTYTFNIALAAGGVLTLTQNVYDGAGTAGANLFTHQSTSTAAQAIATQFDGLAMGYRATNDTNTPAAEHKLDISQIKIDTNVSVPVPVEDANFDNDADVDGNDFLIWQRGVGVGTDNAHGDANDSHTVDGADLAIWKAKFGTPQTILAVPEPSTTACGALAIAALLRRRRRAARG